MGRYILRRVLMVVPVILGILFVTFLIKAAIPTDAVTAMYEGQLSDDDAKDAIAAIRAKFHLDKPWWEQFVIYVGDVMQGDLGESIRMRQPVMDEIGYRFLNTLQLTFASLLIGISLGVIAGIVAAYWKGTWIDVTATTISLFGISMPAFFFGIVVILVLSVWLQWLPVMPRGNMALLMPALTLGLIEAAPLARLTRGAMLDVLSRDYIRAARANGTSETAVLFAHALPNALLAVVTVVGLQIGNLLGGAFIVEVIFGWRGVGELAVKAIQWRDFTLTQAVIVVSAGAYVLINLVVDILYTWIDPRISYQAS